MIEADSIEEAEAMIVDDDGDLVSAAEMESVVEELWRSDLFVESGSEFLDEIAIVSRMEFLDEIVEEFDDA
jgi:F0F1-type ATP synthase delta subunit